eukprot:TRINITY_DN340_c0_g1_i3.p1 TRINITY_DN340_c0_g1~~TRINITY_DN340_c0_g1_i3.p1  ORF type:complete len:616 (-),score=196.04 TRINITY_DN340_c0_g1_i3:152-1999(-)
MIEVLSMGSSRRKVAASRQNPLSSRSHMIVTLRVTSSHTSPVKGQCLSQMRRSLHLVDLQGSEKLADPDDPYHQHTAGINSALLELGKVMRNLAGETRGATDTAMFRGSTLTWVLREALGGASGARICMLLTCSPHEQQYYASSNTLAFGEACTRVKRASVQSAKTYNVAQLRALVATLQGELDAKDEQLRDQACRMAGVAAEDHAALEAELRATLAAKEEECKGHQAAEDQLQRTSQMLDRELARAAQHHVTMETELNAALAAKADECQEYQAAGERLDRKVQELESKAQDLDRELARAAQHHVTLEDSLEGLHQELRDAAAHHVALEQKVESVQAEALDKQAEADHRAMKAEQRASRAEEALQEAQWELVRQRALEQEARNAMQTREQEEEVKTEELEKHLGQQLANTQEAVARAEAETQLVQQAAREQAEEADAISETVRKQWMDRIEQVEHLTWQRAVEHERKQQKGPELWKEVERMANLLEQSETKARTLQAQLERAGIELEVATLMSAEQQPVVSEAKSNTERMSMESLQSGHSVESWYSASSARSGSRSSFDSRSQSHSLEDSWDEPEPGKKAELIGQGMKRPSPNLQPRGASPTVQEHFMFEEGPQF